MKVQVALLLGLFLSAYVAADAVTAEDSPSLETEQLTEDIQTDEDVEGDEVSDASISEDEFKGNDLPSKRIQEANLEDLAVGDAAAKTRTCYAVGDPHFRSFDGDYFHFQGIGEFRLAKCPNMEVQGRTKPCGKHRYYGAVGCYDEAVMKYTNPHTKKTSVVQVNTRATRTIKVNGKDVPFKNDGMVRTASGSNVSPQLIKGSYYDPRKREFRTWHTRSVVIRNDDGSFVIVHAYAIYIAVPNTQRCVGLCGNDNGDKADDYIDAKGKRYNFQSTISKVDNHPGKDIHKWGMTFMVKSKNNPNSNIESLMENPDKWNKPQYRPHQYKFKDDAAGQKLRKEAKECCTKQGFVDYKMYQDCMMDAAMEGLKACENNAKAAAEAREALMGTLKGENERGKHHKHGLLVILHKMEVEFQSDRDDIKDAIMKEAELVKGHYAKVVHAAHAKNIECKAERPMRLHHDKARTAYFVSKGKHEFAVAFLAKNLVPWQKAIELINKESDLIKQMLALVARLRGVKSLSELDIDHDALNELPKLKETFQSLIQRAHDENGEGTTAIRILLEGLLKDLGKEKAAREADIAKAQAAVKRTEAARKHDKKVYDIAAKHLADQVAKCKRWQNEERVRRGIYRTALELQSKNLQEQRKNLSELADEMKMVKQVKRIVTNWAKKKGYGSHMEKHCKVQGEADVQLSSTQDDLPDADENEPEPKDDDDDDNEGSQDMGTSEYDDDIDDAQE